VPGELRVADAQDAVAVGLEDRLLARVVLPGLPAGVKLLAVDFDDDLVRPPQEIGQQRRPAEL
jgi:hypothetical protein